MKYCKRFYFAGIALLTIMAGCSGDEITQYLQTKGAIYGRVVSSETGIRVEVWQSAIVRSANADDDGYFTINELDPGRYRVKIEAPSGVGLEIPDVEVDIARSIDLGVLSLVHPAPLLATSPADGASNVAASVHLALTFSLPIDFGTIDDAITIVPAVEGTWSTSGYSPYQYRFAPLVQFATSTAYSVTIGPGLTPSGQEPWGETVSITFTTDEMKLVNTDWYNSTPNDVPATFTGQLVALRFNTRIDPATLDDGIEISPPIEFESELYTGYQGQDEQIILRLTGGLVGGTSYQINISQDLRDRSGAQLAQPRNLAFATRAFQVEGRSYPHGRTNVPPRLPSYDRRLLAFQYSSNVDLTVAATQISIDPPATLSVTGAPSNFDDLVVMAPDGLQPGTTYTMTIGAGLKSVDGASIGLAETIEFETQPLLLTEFEVSSGGYYGGGNTTVDPGTTFVSRVWLNADVDATAFSGAASFDPPIHGFWFASGDVNQTYLEFFTTQTPQLIPGSSYTLTIEGSIPMAGAAGFESDVIRQFSVNPVAVTSISPGRGSRSAYRYTSVEVRFNTIMDHASTEAAFEMTAGDGSPVPGTFNWYDEKQLTFRPNEPLDIGATYFVDVNTSAMSQIGPGLAEAASTFFQVSN